MPVSGLNITGITSNVTAILTNKSGGALSYGDVVALDNSNVDGFTTTTTSGLSSRVIGVICEPLGIANNGSGSIVLSGFCPRVNLNTAASIGDFLKTHTVAGQATPHSAPQVEGDFGVALQASSTPEAILFGSPNPAPGASAAGTLLAVVNYNPGTATTISTTSTAGQDVDATNLEMSFTVPSSGKVRVVLSAGAFISGGGSAYWWCLRTTGGSNVTGSRKRVSPASAGLQTPATAIIHLSGLPPGATHVFRWGHGVSANSGNVRFGDDGSTGPYGAAVMEVWEAP
jgi:hypothetical protein